MPDQRNKEKALRASVRGKAGEDAVCSYLEKLGYKILERNYYARCGELDIISLKGDGEDAVLCFTEVKTRKFGTDLSNWPPMNDAKRRRVIRTAEKYMYDKEIHGKYWVRYDTAYVTVTADSVPEVMDIEYYKADFTADGLLDIF